MNYYFLIMTQVCVCVLGVLFEGMHSLRLNWCIIYDGLCIFQTHVLNACAKRCSYICILALNVCIPVLVAEHLCPECANMSVLVHIYVLLYASYICHCGSSFSQHLHVCMFVWVVYFLLPFCRWHIQMHFLNRKDLYLNLNFNEGFH